MLNLGHAARRDGRIADAWSFYRDAAATDPSNAEAQSVYGLILLRLHQADAAELPLKRAVSMDPDNPAFAMNLSEWCVTTQRFDQAKTILSQIVAKRPTFHWAWDRLGDLQFRDEHFSAARESFLRAVQANPRDPGPLLKLARADLEIGHLDEAKRAIDDAARLQPDGHAYFRTMAAYHQRTSNWPALETLARERITTEPKDGDAWLALSRAQLQLRKLRPSLESYRTAVELGSATAVSLAALCMQVNAFDTAAEALRMAEEQDPTDLGVLRLKSGLLMYQGAHAEAESYCERLLALSPNDGNAYRVLVQLNNARLPEPRFQTLLALSTKNDLPDTDRILACYAAADCLDMRGNFGAAFQKYQQANAIARRVAAAAAVRYDRQLHEDHIQRLIRHTGCATAPPPASSTRKLAFIVGMPRSGTTLIESVLSAHSEVAAGGEYHAMRWIMEDVAALIQNDQLRTLDATKWQSWRELYLEGLHHRAGAQIITDKHPFNFDAVGIISRLFPDARIIHVRRNPVETCLSIFRNHFEGRHSFATDLEDIGHYYGQYVRLMHHLERQFSDRVTTIQYEHFVTQFETACPALIESCGLKWEPQCFDYDKSERLISTLSTMQARQPPRLSERAKNYASHLQPLLDELKAQHVDLESGSLRGGAS